MVICKAGEDSDAWAGATTDGTERGRAVNEVRVCLCVAVSWIVTMLAVESGPLREATGGVVPCKPCKTAVATATVQLQALPVAACQGIDGEF